MKLGQNRDALQKMRQELEIFDHFSWYVTAHMWASLAADSGASLSVGDARGGILSIVTGATDNNEAALATANECFLFGADRPMTFETLLQYTEPGTNEGNVAFGVADAIAANLITDNGAALAIPNSGAMIYKLDGGTVWRCGSKNNGVSNDTVSVQTAGGSAYQRLRIEVIAIDGTNLEITYFLDGAPLTDSNNKPIKHRLAYASATEMDFGVYTKTGATATTQTTLVDYIYGAMRL